MGDYINSLPEYMDIETAAYIIRTGLDDDSISHEKRRVAIESAAMAKNACDYLTKLDFHRALQFIFRCYDFE